MTKINEPLLLSIRESASLLAVGVSTLRALVASGEIQCTRIGGRVMLQTETVKELAANGWEGHGPVRNLRHKQV